MREGERGREGGGERESMCVCNCSPYNTDCITETWEVSCSGSGKSI